VTFDTGGRGAQCYDVSRRVGAMTGVDDPRSLTKTSAGNFKPDYTPFLKVDRQRRTHRCRARFMGKDAEVDRVIEASILRSSGSRRFVVESDKISDFVLQARTGIFLTVMNESSRHRSRAYSPRSRSPASKDVRRNGDERRTTRLRRTEPGEKAAG